MHKREKQRTVREVRDQVLVRIWPVTVSPAPAEALQIAALVVESILILQPDFHMNDVLNVVKEAYFKVD
jgi:hypothetical protein